MGIPIELPGNVANGHEAWFRCRAAIGRYWGNGRHQAGVPKMTRLTLSGHQQSIFAAVHDTQSGYEAVDLGLNLHRILRSRHTCINCRHKRRNLAPMSLTYNPNIFQADDLKSAMKIILTAEDSSTDARWKTETPYVANIIGKFLPISRESLLLDYGCGVGRVAKELIARHGCRVIGTDISPQMRALAPIYVDSDRFAACSPTMLDCLMENSVIFDAAVVIWVLQHCLKPADDVARIRRALKPDSRLFVLNNIQRVVPTVEQGWYDDGFDVHTLLCREFTLLQEGKPSLEQTTPLVAKHTYWAAFGCGH